MPQPLRPAVFGLMACVGVSLEVKRPAGEQIIVVRQRDAPAPPALRTCRAMKRLVPFDFRQVTHVPILRPERTPAARTPQPLMFEDLLAGLPRFPVIDFHSPIALVLLVVLPAWWWWRRKRPGGAITFSRTA